MKRDYIEYIEDILRSIEEIDIFTAGMSFDDFVKDKKTINAVIRSFEVMGEAAKIIPDSVKKHYPAIPWKYMSGMRDKLIHEYFGVDTEILWTVIKEELPPLKPVIKKLINDLHIKENGN